MAVTANGDKQGYYACGFYGYQDTLYAKSGKQYYSNSYIEGATDYIFGNAAAWFGECTIANKGGGPITATSRTTNSEATWYVFDHSTVSLTTTFNFDQFLTMYRSLQYLALIWLEKAISVALGGSTLV